MRRGRWALLAVAVLAPSATASCSGSIGPPEERDDEQRGSDAAVRDAGDAPDDTSRDAATDTLDASDARDAGMEPDAEAERDAAMAGCGDGKLQSGEACDDGNDTGSDGCSADCRHIEQDYVCPSPGEACVYTVQCGDGRIGGREQCDDGNRRQGDGCTRDCELEPGYACPDLASACVAAKCGDGILAGDEACEDGDATPVDGDGCSESCQVEPGFVCLELGAPCMPTVCNDGVRQGAEACDDGNMLVRDGCTPFCEVEPDCSAGPCRSRCGDGLILPNDDEECDDGNTADGDGCSDACTIEPGYTCVLEQNELPDTLSVPVTYRDFIALPVDGATRHPDFESFRGSVVTAGMVASALGSDGKPVYTGVCDESRQPYPDPPDPNSPCPENQQMTSQAAFDQWYRDVPGVNVTKVERMQLARQPSGRAFAIANSAFFPWDDDPNSWVGRDMELDFEGHDFGFTSEIHTYFEYRPNPDEPPTLRFSGDDDVWVFINRSLAVDIGGSHGELERSVTLDESTAASLRLEAGRIYEIALFHAERHTPASNFNLTLEGFAAARSHCEPRCGDGVITRTESCDDGTNDGSYGSCTPDCRRGSYCGDGKRDADHEACDDGVNLTTYSATGEPACAPGCKPSAYCGDGNVDSRAGEQCDDGENRGGYGRCGRGCKLGPRCGDGERQADDGEECDDGNLLGNDGCSSQCKSEGPI